MDPSSASNANASTPSSGQQSIIDSSTLSQRRKTDPTWDHFSFKKEGRTNVYTCLHCLSVYKGGGINRMKQHLAGVTGQIMSCKKVPHDVRHQMLESLKNVQQKKQTEELNEAYDDQQEVEESPQPSKRVAFAQASGKKRNSTPKNYFAPRTTPGSQPTLKSVLSSKEAIYKAKMAIAKWFCDACIPFNAINSPYFQEAVDAVAAIGPGFKGPSYHELRVNLLGDCKKECQLLVENHRSNWAKTGCTIMADGWSDQRQRTLINFLVHCTAGVIFVKSVDASDLVKDAQMLFNLFSEVIEWVGPSNVVHIVTDNAANYVAAGRLDIGSMPFVSSVASRASKVTIFVYNHMTFLAWLRKREVKIVAPIVHLLRIVDADEKPSMGYVYEGMHRAKKAIKEMFKGKKEMYKPYTDIIKARWHKHFRCDLHAAAYYFNPAFFYDEKFVEKNNITQAALRLLEIRSICNDLAKRIQEMQVYYDRKGSFGRESARTVTRTIRPEAPPDFDDQKFDNENVIYQEHAFPAESSRQGVEENDMNITDQPILDVEYPAGKIFGESAIQTLILAH
ncbi:hypothetical protein G2W53_003701 [Senna tora]|uniref:BED-type domain-containing protein n=1 Tax=Senna tora TaxID=362788 RepID=A0A834X954_9FABA|nr:hypothetical protein G2W53_003701 [Senna tora]